MSDQPKTSRIKIWQIIVGGIIVLILIGLIVPSVRASISSWLGLSVAPSSQVTTVPVTLEAVATSATQQASVATAAPPPAVPATPEPAQSVILPVIKSGSGGEGSVDLNQLSSQAGWTVLTPTYLPEGYEYQSAYFDTTNKMLVLTYLITRSLPGATDPTLTSSETITLLEAKSNNFVPMQVAPDTAIQEIQVNGDPAVFTLGGWDTQYVKDNTAPGGGKMVSSWRNDLPVKNLYWQVGDVYMLLVTPDIVVTEQELIDMAASIGK